MKVATANAIVDRMKPIMPPPRWPGEPAWWHDDPGRHPVFGHNFPMATLPQPHLDRKLQLKEVLDWLAQDGMIDLATAAKLLADARVGRSGHRHPLAVIGDARL